MSVAVSILRIRLYKNRSRRFYVILLANLPQLRSSSILLTGILKEGARRMVSLRRFHWIGVCCILFMDIKCGRPPHKIAAGARP